MKILNKNKSKKIIFLISLLLLTLFTLSSIAVSNLKNHKSDINAYVLNGECIDISFCEDNIIYGIKDSTHYYLKSTDISGNLLWGYCLESK